LKIKTIGKPGIINDEGEHMVVRGQQSWALLAPLLLAERPPSRRMIANELFSDAADPLGALRWCLASLRRALGSGTLRGDPIELNLPDDVDVDIWRITSSNLNDIEPAEFLEGIEPAASAEFSTWMLIAREQVASTLHDELRRSAINALARSDSRAAIRHAERAARLRPLDESGHVLLVKALTAAGKSDAAVAHIEATEREFEKQVGEMPSPALRLAARKTVADPPNGISEVAVIESLVKSGAAAVAAGAVDAGLDYLRQAAAKADEIADPRLIAQAFHELGTALVHAIRGFDDEGAVMLRKAADTAAEIGASRTAAAALYELGYVDALAGRRPVAANHLRDALNFAHGDDDSLAGVHAITGFNLVDWGKSDEGLLHFEQSLAFSRKSGNRRREIWSLGIGGWGQMRAGNVAQAEDWLTTCLALCEEARWIAFQPWPQAILVEVKLAQGRVDDSTQALLEEALALSAQLGDPCWEAANARSIALLKIDGGDFEEADGGSNMRADGAAWSLTSMPASWLKLSPIKCVSITELDIRKRPAPLLVICCRWPHGHTLMRTSNLQWSQSRRRDEIECPDKAMIINMKS